VDRERRGVVAGVPSRRGRSQRGRPRRRLVLARRRHTGRVRRAHEGARVRGRLLPRAPRRRGVLELRGSAPLSPGC